MLSLTELRAHAREIFSTGLDSVDPLRAVKRAIQIGPSNFQVGDRRYSFDEIQKIVVIGCGKAAAPMGLAIEDLFGNRIAGGIIVVKYGHRLRLKRIRLVEAGHPIPDFAGLNGARRIARLLRSCGERDVIFFVLSGGASALTPYPAFGLSLADEKQTTDVLLKSGATIAEINAVRKHLSRLKGGRLAKLAAPAKLITLILSDVVGDSLEVIGSGPTVPDSTTYADCLQILDRYSLRSHIPVSVLQYLERGVRGEIEETPKALDSIFHRVQNVIVGSNRMAVMSAHRRAEELGYHAMIWSDAVQGESRAVARSFCRTLKQIAQRHKPVSRPACLIAGGETTVTVLGTGLGGRSQEFALACAIELNGIDRAVVLSAGTDGTDGPTDAAGGMVDGNTVQRALAAGFDPVESLNRNDSYHLLKATSDLFFTGPTLTNVMDLQLGLIS